MTEKELSKYYYLKKEIQDLEERITKLGYGVGAVEITDMPKGVSNTNNTIQQKVAELREKYIEARVSALEEYLKIENYIMTIEDVEIRTMMRLRFLDLKSWEVIGREYYCDRRTASRKVHKYIKKNAHNARQNVLL